MEKRKPRASAASSCRRSGITEKVRKREKAANGPGVKMPRDIVSAGRGEPQRHMRSRDRTHRYPRSRETERCPAPRAHKETERPSLQPRKPTPTKAIVAAPADPHERRSARRSRLRPSESPHSSAPPATS